MIHNDYWRAIAKMGFHYYLLNNRRGFRGSETEFADIRLFIIEGGDHGPFFTNTAAQFALPFGELSDDSAVLPKDWSHVLAADESGQAAIAMVSLFKGPERFAPQYHPTLGRFSLMMLSSWCAHAYLYKANSLQNHFTGHVVELSMTRLR